MDILQSRQKLTQQSAIQPTLVSFNSKLGLATMSTLGFESDTRICKAEIAQTQLVEAIDLFLAGKFLCAITLAGAAEEIFARLLNQRGEISIVEESFKAIQDIREMTGLSVMRGKPKNEIFK